MPLYEYECDQCESRFELIRRFADPPLAACPSCGGAVRKLISSPAIQFKGTGWYITDYARKGTDAGKDANASGGKADGDKGEKTAKKTSEGSEKAAKSEKRESTASTDRSSASSGSSTPRSSTPTGSD